MGKVRAKIEVLSARLYGISVVDFDLIMRDYPLIDRAQPPIPGEVKSTITRDIIVATGDIWSTRKKEIEARDRVDLARSIGAVPFVPNQHARAYQIKL